jgi:amino-acid N-acetyltransferase
MDDLPAVLALLKEAGLPSEGVVDHFPEAYVVIRDGEAIRAVAGLEPYGEAGLLRSVAVSPAARRRGLGLAITETLLRDAVDRGFRQVFLLTTTAADFFRKLGFIETVREEAPVEMRLSPEFAGACPSSAVCLEKLLR